MATSLPRWPMHRICALLICQTTVSLGWSPFPLVNFLNLELNKLKARNRQDWEFVSSLGNCTNLQTLSLFSNQLEGHVPTSLGNLSVELQILLLGNNQLSGGFPSGIANLRNLMWLGLHGNQFTGNVPE